MNQTILQRNNVNISGKGNQYMIFAPGFGCNQSMWRMIASEFEKDYRVVLFDYVGTGNSDLQAYNKERYSDLSGYVQDVLDICEAIDAHNAIFVGHSVGSMIGILASIREPKRFERLVLIGPSPCYENKLPDYYGGFSKEDLTGLIDLMEKNFAGWANYLASAVMQNPDRPLLAAELEISFCSIQPDIARLFAVATFFADNRKDLPLVPVPALILQSNEDVIAPVKVGEYVHQSMPQSTYKLMKATGHCPHMSHPEETIQLIHEFLGILIVKDKS
ncbi:alpha/beta fold hydrolase [Paenibacillus wynnii]|uniref:Sigma factor SigB regulation protein RsbQ n=1 Tax=Paenibacillus wynnii TaxID=268407 RepID=A0A098MB04_9BACL|nr:alpha/beta hydrolase [Paenibacillus wynnii]KGE19725.1 sigma factor SigB regulation protein RsbQ [Paenibacillus wynnii]